MSYCQRCLKNRPTKKVTFTQNIGMLVMRQYKELKGRFCMECIHQVFWSMTITTIFLGWWGVISLIITPFLLLNNIGHYIFAFINPPTMSSDQDNPEFAKFIGMLSDLLNQGIPIEHIYFQLKSQDLTEDQAALLTSTASENELMACNTCNLHYKKGMQYCTECGSILSRP